MITHIFKHFLKKREDIIHDFNELVQEIESNQNEINLIFYDKHLFIEPEIKTIWEHKKVHLSEKLEARKLKKFKRLFKFRQLLKSREILLNSLNNFQELISEHNNKLAYTKINHAYSLIGNIEGRKLDQQQMLCIVKESHNQLVIAGAGTGKTTTVIGKIKYLLKTKKNTVDEILGLSFTNVSAKELSERIYAETGSCINAVTFHKLGLEIIRSASQNTPSITNIELRKFVKEYLKELMKNEEYLKLITTYLINNRVVPRSEFDFNTQAEYDEYLKLNPPTTLKKEVVKSYGEMDIANFLYQNGIDYIYEHPYTATLNSDSKVSYKPDFFLPSYGIYVEYFGINRKGQVPSYFTAPKNMTASQKYLESMDWKRDLHARNKTLMIESYSFEKFENVLLENLKLNLENKSVKFTPKTATEMWKELAGEGETVLDGLIEIFETVINLVKSNNYTFEDLRRLNVGNKNQLNNSIFITLCEPIFNEYNKKLIDKNEIDFNDMINLATRYINEGKFKNRYRFVIVDEYQDISKSRFLLLKALRESQDFKVFCVGDDWQSIYRFAGSDVGLILDFDNHWGPSIQDKIETTYRFNQNLIDISGQFIMQNPAQLKKELRNNNTPNDYALSEVNGYTANYAVKFLVDKLKELPKGSSVIFIGRYNYDANILNSEGIYHRYNNQTKNTDVIISGRLDLRVEFMTAHRSKGLQADYVVIINNKDGVSGFPIKITDNPILELLLHNYEVFPFAEERRLYYVALTRAKKKVILLTIKNRESEFALYLKRKYGHEIAQEKYSCPECGGRLIRKNGKYGEFYGCTNYSSRNCKFTRRVSDNKLI